MRYLALMLNAVVSFIVSLAPYLAASFATAQLTHILPAYFAYPLLVVIWLAAYLFAERMAGCTFNSTLKSPRFIGLAALLASLAVVIAVSLIPSSLLRIPAELRSIALYLMLIIVVTWSQHHVRLFFTWGGDLFSAIRQGDVALVRRLLPKMTAVIVNTPDRGGETPLTLAIKTSAPDGEIITLLLDAGADPHTPNASGLTPLLVASAAGAVSAVELLLQRGVDPDGRMPNGDTPLHQAAQRGYPTIAETLLDAGAEPDARNAQGRTPLHLAAERGSLAIVTLLLAYGANPHLTDNQGSLPLTLVEQSMFSGVRAGREQITALLKGSNPA